MNFEEYWQSAWNPSDNMPEILSMAFREIAEKAWDAATKAEWNEAIITDMDQIGLIAAAPETAAERDRLKEINAELLAALERTLSWLTSCPGGGTMGPSGPYEQARAAIAKATGDQK